jgi:hypothetical protein
MNSNCTHLLLGKSHLKRFTRRLGDPVFGQIVRNGSYFRKSDSKRIDRFFCRNCEVYFSRASFNECKNQKKRRVNAKLKLLLCSGVSQRRAAVILEINRKTVAKKLVFLGDQARRNHAEFLKRYEAENSLSFIQFDDLETSEHTKCKPLSVALAVEPSSRKILSFMVSQMPAKGHLAKFAFKKYGYRRDERARGWNDLFLSLKPIVKEDAVFLSDENPHYPLSLKRHFPQSTHQTVKGKRGCVAGQGELKKIGFDPLFSLNHSCAMLRANINRLFRRTWCSTKKREALIHHLNLYVNYHNECLEPSSAG